MCMYGDVRYDGLTTFKESTRSEREGKRKPSIYSTKEKQGQERKGMITIKKVRG